MHGIRALTTRVCPVSCFVRLFFCSPVLVIINSLIIVFAFPSAILTIKALYKSMHAYKYAKKHLTRPKLDASEFVWADMSECVSLMVDEEGKEREGERERERWREREVERERERECVCVCVCE